MLPHPDSIIMRAEERHREFQAEAARRRLMRQGEPRRRPGAKFGAVTRHRLGLRFAWAETRLRNAFTSVPERQRSLPR